MDVARRHRRAWLQGRESRAGLRVLGVRREMGIVERRISLRPEQAASKAWTPGRGFDLDLGFGTRFDSGLDMALRAARARKVSGRGVSGRGPQR